MYGTPDLEHVSYLKKHLFPAPLGGLEAATPQNGWTFVQIPGALKIPQNVFAIFFWHSVHGLVTVLYSSFE